MSKSDDLRVFHVDNGCKVDLRTVSDPATRNREAALLFPIFTGIPGPDVSSVEAARYGKVLANLSLERCR